VPSPLLEHRATKDPVERLDTRLADLGFTVDLDAAHSSAAANGMALMGMRPIIEMQFADFISTGFDAIVQFAASTHYRWGGSVPWVIGASSTPADEAFHHLDAPVRRLGGHDVPVPFSPPLEDEHRPDATKAAAAVRALCEW
jgi:pyruvate/2-oxoglutarate/acetoin dehydrogenase E1 component